MPLSATARRNTILAAILLSMFLAAMEATVVATAMPSIVADLRGLELYGWVGAVYMLASTLTMPLYGKVADLYGRKPVLAGSLFIFVLASIACGFAPTMTLLVVFRGLQGIGAGGIQPIALTIIGDLYRPEERGKVQGLFGAVWAFAGTSGPLLGGLLVHALSWRWVFFVNVPFAVLSFVLLLSAFDEKVKKKDKVSFDLLGSFLLSVSVSLLLAGASRIAPLYTLPSALLVFAAFCKVETTAADPVLPPKLLLRNVILVSCISGATTGALMSATITYLPLYAQAVLGASPTGSGMLLGPLLVAWPIASTMAGRALPRVGFRPFVRIGLLIALVASVGLYVTVRMRAPIGAVAVFMGVLGVGLGLSSVATVIAVQESAAWNERGVATASTMFFRTIGGALAVGGMGTLVARAVGAHASPSLLNDLLGPEHGKNIPKDVLVTLSDDLAVGTTDVFAIVLVLGVIAALAGLAFPKAPPKRPDEIEPESTKAELLPLE